MPSDAMFNFAEASIRRKLQFLILSSIFLMLLIAGSILMVNTFLSNRSVLYHEANALTEVMTEAVIPAVIFDDKLDAEQILNTLKSLHNIEYTAIFKNNEKQPFAFFKHPGGDLLYKSYDSPQECPVHEFSWTHLYLCKKIMIEDNAEGRLVMLVSLADIYQQLLWQALIALLGLGVSSIFIFWLMNGFSKKMLAPIHELLAISEEITRSGQYEQRATIYTNDEIGRLAKAFNAMLDKIQYWHEQLTDQKLMLEKMVEERTHDLIESKNKALQLAEQADLASKAKSDFLSVMSHEIRTPLNAIIGFSALIKETRLDSRQAEFVRIINQSAEGLLGQLNDILDFSKIEAGKMELENTSFDLYQLLINVQISHRYACSIKSIHFQVTIAEHLPRYIQGDEQKIRQILFNLVNNAIKFTRKGGIYLHVEILEQNHKECLMQFSIRDTGLGIPQDRLDALFQPFTQADTSTTRNFGGTGLGLAIVKSMVKLMGGEITVNSQPGLGTEFVFKIPLRYGRFKTPDEQPLVHKLALFDDQASSSLLQLLQSIGYRVELIRSKKLQQVQRYPGQIKSFQLLLFTVSQLQQIGFWRQRLKKEQLNIPMAILASADECRTLAEQSVEVPVIAVNEDRLRLVEQVEHLINVLGTDSSASIKFTGQTVLVVDDNPINLLMTQRMLKQLGIKSLSATNGQQALEIYQAQEISLILMDCHMPVMDGFAATRTIRELEKTTGRHVPVIALTADAFNDNRQISLASGMDDFISKPFVKEQLLHIFEIWLGKSQITLAAEYGGKGQHSEQDVQSSNYAGFQEQADNLIAQVETAFANQNVDEVAALVRQFQQMSQQYEQSHKLRFLLEELEQIARQGDYFAAVGLWKPVLDAYQEVLRQI